MNGFQVLPLTTLYTPPAPRTLGGQRGGDGADRGRWHRLQVRLPTAVLAHPGKAGQGIWQCVVT